MHGEEHPDADRSESSIQYLSFVLGTEEYAVDVLKVQEIRSYEQGTRIPHTPDYVIGILNLRGAVVPIIDLRRRFDLEAKFDATTVTVLVKAQSETKERTVGLVVDAVSDVYDVLPEDRKEAPDRGQVIGTEFIEGLATLDDKLVILLDVDNLVNAGVLDRLDQPQKA
ncbi:MAG TPA: chemotaxis protein CheW [Pseudomonadales bacterium]|nr:chemotaxis protein CheW [Pseudomonadales bacterium]